MKSLRISFIVTTIIIAAFLCSGFAAALNQDEASAQALFSSGDTFQAGQTVTGTIYFTSTSADVLNITDVGIHFDWMPSGVFIGYSNLSSTTSIIIPSGGGSQTLPTISVKVPDGTVAGSHTYYIAIDGTQGDSSTPFYWNSTTAETEVIASASSPTPTSTNSGGGLGQTDLLLLVVAAAVVVVVVVLMLVIVMRKKRTKPKPETKQTAGQPVAPSPEKKPETGQDFNI
jgi:hypothetical protein